MLHKFVQNICATCSKISVWSIILLLPVLFSQPLFSQDVDKLRNERESLLKEIESTRNLLNTKRTSREETFALVNILAHEIEVRESLINNFRQEIEALNLQIEQNQLNINELELSIKVIKDEYVRLLQDTYLRRNSMNELLFFLSAKNFSEAYHRHRLLKEYSSYRQRQGQALIENQNQLKLLMQKIEVQRENKEASLNKLEKEYASLNESQLQKQKLIGELQKEEQWLKQQLAEKERQAKVLESQILEYIRQSQSEKSTYGKDFAESMGKLIWPVSGGVVVNHFGEHEHPVLKGVVIKNNGIDIQSTLSNEAVAVYPGEISRVITIPGYNNAIIIRHGDYLTVYANLKDIQVKQGQKVETGEQLGTLYKEDNEANGVLHFEIWKESQKLNPVQCLRP
ncbi:MAG: peptidoglycan DD-metalloendopeptidase family protein [Cytophagaceae bacterium]|nr:peptidoglycan DD-metalloendopeptidase family protein [Cytophagaceae bacterium]